MKPSTYLIPAEILGKLIIMPKPSGEWPEEDVQYYKELGVDLIVSILEKCETEELGLINEKCFCERNSIKFLQLEVRDRNLPDDRQFAFLVGAVVDALKQGNTVAVHCRAGIGRSAMVVTAALLHFSYSFDESISLVSTARGVEVPDTQEQKRFIKEYALKINNH